MNNLFAPNEAFAPVRRSDRLMEQARAIELLETAEYGFLALGAGENGYGYGVPMSFAYDHAAQCLYFHCAPQGHKIDNIGMNNKVSFCVVGHIERLSDKFTTLYESVIAFGRATIDLTDDQRRTALRLLVAKYSPQHTSQGETYMERSLARTLTFRIAIEHITAKCKV